MPTFWESTVLGSSIFYIVDSPVLPTDVDMAPRVMGPSYICARGS